MQRTLHTARLLLTPLADEHLEHEVELDLDPEVMRYLDDGVPRRREEVLEDHRRRLALAALAPGLGVWVGFLDGGFVGWWVLEPPHRVDQGPVEGQAELGFRLLPAHWRRGLAGEGSRELLRHAFVDLGLTRVFAETMAVNAASRATMASLGMQYVRTFAPDYPPMAGSEHGEVEYAISCERWAGR